MQFFSPRKIALARRNNGMINLPLTFFKQKGEGFTQIT